MVVRAADSVVDFVHGVALGEASNPSGEFDVGSELLTRIEARPAGEIPTLRQVFGAPGGEGLRNDIDTGFEAGLDILGKGIEAIAGEEAHRGRTG